MRKTAAELLAERTVRDDNGCLVWIRGKTTDGYGSVCINGKMDKTHRVAWTLAYGPIPSGMCVCHHCDNPPCCEPTHLFLGTHSDNMRDRQIKGRTKNLEKGWEALRIKRAAINAKRSA